MKKTELENIIKQWSSEFKTRVKADGSIEVYLKVGVEMSPSISTYNSMEEAISISFVKTKKIVMAVCGELERIGIA